MKPAAFGKVGVLLGGKSAEREEYSTRVNEK